MDSLRYIFASFALGAITIWGSENLFWFAPPDGLTPADWGMTWVAYSLCAGAVLSVVLWTGAGGWRGLYLAGVLFGYLIEGVVVDTIYADFPVQLVWTAMAWHGLFTVLVLVAALHVAPRWPLVRHLGLLLGIAVFAGVFALFWPVERENLPGGDVVLFYLAGVGVIVPLAHVLLDRLGPLRRPPAVVLWALPGLAVVVWGGKTVVAFDWVRLAFPGVVGLTIWAMMRLGDRKPLALGPKSPVWRHFLFLLVPLVAVTVVVPVWSSGAQWPTNWLVFSVTVPVSLGLWIWLIIEAVRNPKAVSAKP